MKRIFLFLFIAVALTYSCSSDSDDGPGGGDTASNLIGTWDLSGIAVDEATANDDLVFAQGIVDVLLAQNCNLLSITFNADNTAILVDRDFGDIEINLDPSGGGLDIPCPAESNTETVTYELNGNTLTITFQDETQETATISLNGDMLTIGGEFVDEDNLAEAEAVFTRR